MSDSKILVLVSGTSGYIASHVVKLLQQDSYRVRGTVHSVKDEKKVKQLYNICPSAKHKLELVEVDLLDAESWTRSGGIGRHSMNDNRTGMKCLWFTAVQRIASHFPARNPRNENEVIKPGVKGTLNVLRVAAESGTVKRVVLTSSVSAVLVEILSHAGKMDWMDEKTPGLLTYVKSKILAERAM